MSTYFSPEESTKIIDNSDKNIFEKAFMYYQQINDKALYYKNERWAIAAVLVFLYFCRLLISGGFYALTYCIGIHVLNSFLGFISPLEDPEDCDDGSSFLPQKNSEEYRPFERKVKEFTFWQSCFWAFLIGFFLTFNKSVDIPVYWPLLLVYFILIFYITMRKQINHMIKYNYLPWDYGKARYNRN